MNVEGLPQNTTAPTNTTTINMFTENKEVKPIAARTRKTTFKIELPKKAVGVTKAPAKLIDMVVPRRNPNIVYEDFIEEDFTLLKK
jgi:hypothetical protein